MYALDTNTVLDYFRRKGGVGTKLLAVSPAEVALPAVAAYEVWVGVLGSPNERQRQAEYERFLSLVELLPFDATAARRAAELRVALLCRRRSSGRNAPAGACDRRCGPRGKEVGRGGGAGVRDTLVAARQAPAAPCRPRRDAARARPFDLDPEALLRDGGVAEVSVDCDNP